MASQQHSALLLLLLLLLRIETRTSQSCGVQQDLQLISHKNCVLETAHPEAGSLQAHSVADMPTQAQLQLASCPLHCSQPNPQTRPP